MNQVEVKALVSKALPGLTPAESLALRGVALLETSDGAGWGIDPAKGAGSNNMGAVTDPSYVQGAPAKPNQFLHTDSRPATPKEIASGIARQVNGNWVVSYTTAFKRYATPEAGFQDLAAIMLKPNVKAAAAKNSVSDVSAAMFANHYYTGVLPTPQANINAHATTLKARITDIVKATGEANPFSSPLSPAEGPAVSLPPQSGLPQSLPSLGLLTNTLPSLKRGSTGTAVFLWQKYLFNIGISIMRNGVFDENTESYTKLYQSNRNLSVDGQVGPQTWNSMFL